MTSADYVETQLRRLKVCCHDRERDQIKRAIVAHVGKLETALQLISHEGYGGRHQRIARDALNREQMP